MSLNVGNVVEGVVTGITDFGAFVKLPDGRTGLVHISEVADTYVKDIRNYVQKNDRVKVKILNFRDGGEKIGLSMRQVDDEQTRKRQSKREFENKLKRFMKSSERRLKDARTQADGRRGGGGGGGGGGGR